MKTIKIKDDGKLKTSELFNKIEEKYPGSWCSWNMDDLDKYCPPKISERTFLDSDEPEIKGLSWNDMKSQGKLNDCMNVREYMIMTLDHGLKDTVDTWTQLSDSFTDKIAYGYSQDGGFGLYWDSRGVANANVGFRAVVNLDTLPLDTSLENAIKICKENGLRVLKTVTEEIEL